MPAKAGIHDVLCCNEESWIPAFAGMTGGTVGGSILRPLV
jgi:hypothetical protein